MLCLLQSNKTALHIAALNGHSEVIGYLLTHGAAVNAVDKVSYRNFSGGKFWRIILNQPKFSLQTHSCE